jgi:hypothetical protein
MVVGVGPRRGATRGGGADGSRLDGRDVEQQLDLLAHQHAAAGELLLPREPNSVRSIVERISMPT